MRFASGVTMSGSAPGMSWSISSITVTFGAERVVDRRHLEPDDAAAEDQHPLRDESSSSAPVESDHARVVVRDEPGATGSEPAAMIALSKRTILRALRRLDREVVGRGELAVAGRPS